MYMYVHVHAHVQSCTCTTCVCTCSLLSWLLALPASIPKSAQALQSSKKQQSWSLCDCILSEIRISMQLQFPVTFHRLCSYVTSNKLSLLYVINNYFDLLKLRFAIKLQTATTFVVMFNEKRVGWGLVKYLTSRRGRVPSLLWPVSSVRCGPHSHKIC